MRLRRVAVLALPALIAGGCASPSLTLLPDEGGGHQGAVAVLEYKGKKRDEVVAEGNTRTRLVRRAATSRLDAKQTDQAEIGLISQLPPPPHLYIFYFRPDMTEPVAERSADLKTMVDDITTRPGVEVEVIGYTDTRADSDYNSELSKMRAERIVQQILRDPAVSPDSITKLEGRGESELRQQTADNVANQENRRVEVTVR